MVGAPQLARWRTAFVAMILAVASFTWVVPTASPATAAGSSDLEHLCALNDYTPAILPQFTALGEDGNVWFTDLVGIGRVTPSGVMTMFSAGVPLGTVITRIVAGPDGALWYLMPMSPASVGRITTDGVATVFTAALPANSKPVDIAAGPDGNLWISGENTKTIYRMTPSGTVTPFALPQTAGAGAITAGSDGNLWFSAGTATIGRITPTGDITLFTTGLPSDTVIPDLTLGPDGDVWFADIRGRLGHISTTGDVTMIQVPPRTVDLPDDASQEVRDQVEFLLNNPVGGPTEIITADANSLWFSERFGGRIGRVTTGGQVTFVDLKDLPVPEDIFPESVTEHLDEVTLAQMRASAGYVWQLGGLSVGSDGNLWLRTGASTSVPAAAISRMTPDGRITSSPGSAYQTIGSDEVVGPDGRLWYLAGGFGVGYVEPDGHSAVFLVTGARTSSTPGSLTIGPDGNIWFTEVDRDRIVRMTPSGVSTRFATGISAGAAPFDITTGPDGNIWFTEGGLKRIGRMTLSGDATEFSAGVTGVPGRIVGGSGENLWFTEIDPATGTHVRLARITTSGVVTELPIETNARITDVTSDGEGNVWVLGDTVGASGMSTAGWIDRITPDGTITRTEIDSGFDLELTKSITVVDGDLWFAMEAVDVVNGTLDLSTYDPLGSLWRMTPDGTVTRFDTSPVHPLGVPNEGLFPPIQHVAGGPDGALWFSRLTALPNLYRGTVPDHAGNPCAVTGLAPTVSGRAQVGQTLTAHAGAVAPADATLSYQWSAGGDPITGATASTLTLKKAQAGKTITVTITGAKTGLTSQTKTSDPTPYVREKVNRAQLTLSKSTVKRGGSVTLLGQGFTPGNTYAVRYNASILGTGGTVIGTFTADAYGELTTPITIPSGSPTGPVAISITGANPALVLTTITVTP